MLLQKIKFFDVLEIKIIDKIVSFRTFFQGDIYIALVMATVKI